MSATLYWCERCGMVWAQVGVGPPLCRHYALDLSARVMVPLPLWHPYAKALS